MYLDYNKDMRLKIGEQNDESKQNEIASCLKKRNESL